MSFASTAGRTRPSGRWHSPATGFVQSVPDTRKPSSEKTEVRALYDPKNIYFGAWCFVKDPGTIRYYEFFRDFGVYNTDTFRDPRSAICEYAP